MSGLIVFIAAVVVFAILDILAQTHGVDSRDGFEDASVPCGLSV